MAHLRRKPVCVARGSHCGVVCRRVEVANTFLARFVGLLGRRGLAEDAGLWLRPSSGVHTFGMKFAIDVVALDAEMKVVELHRCLKAWKIAATGSRIRSVLELPAGQIDASGVTVGESISMEGIGERAFASERGSALVEFSLLLPMLVYLFVGIVDYALETQQTMQIMEAATAGAAYGAINGNEQDLSGMQAAARRSAAGVNAFNVTATNVFACTPGGAPVTSTTVCVGYGTPIEYVKVTTGATVPTLLPFPGLPASLTLQQTAIYRVPWKP